MLEVNDVYRELALASREEIKVKGSKFIADAFPVTDVAGVKQRLGEVRAQEHKASHHCFGYVIGADGSDARYDDDGEPTGSAGRPILQQIKSRQLTNTMIVVTRYFGGTKLGVGGLVRAYGDAARTVLEHSSTQERIVRTLLKVVFPYEETSPAMHAIGLHDIEIVHAVYGEKTELLLNIRISHVASFKAIFVDSLRGRGDVIEERAQTP